MYRKAIPVIYFHQYATLMPWNDWCTWGLFCPHSDLLCSWRINHVLSLCTFTLCVKNISLLNAILISIQLFTKLALYRGDASFQFALNKLSWISILPGKGFNAFSNWGFLLHVWTRETRDQCCCHLPAASYSTMSSSGTPISERTLRRWSVFRKEQWSWGRVWGTNLMRMGVFSLEKKEAQGSPCHSQLAERKV